MIAQIVQENANTDLQGIGLSFVDMGDGLLRVYLKGGVWVDYYPGTRHWSVCKPGSSRQRGIKSLLDLAMSVKHRPQQR